MKETFLNSLICRTILVLKRFKFNMQVDSKRLNFKLYLFYEV